ncbi:MAG: META domain-containing protein [Muribaculaceae bacterium]|nr:META domain-containing protein [Muribaculaceae bacterium]
MKFRYTLLGTVAICSLAACNSSKVPVTAAGQVKTETLGQTEGVISHVLYGEWTAAHVGTQAVEGENRPYLIFDKSGANPFVVNCYANDGCNTLNGTFAVTPGGSFKASSDMASTMRMCPDAPYELGFGMALRNVRNYKIEQVGRDYLLYFIGEDGNTLMTLRKSDISFINGAWKVMRIGSQELKADNETEMVIDIPELKVHGNAGCNVLNGTLYIDPDKQNSLQFRDLVTSRMTCPDIATEQAFLVALEKVETVAPGSDSETAYLKDASGNTLITLQRLNLVQE